MVQFFLAGARRTAAVGCFDHEECLHEKHEAPHRVLVTVF